VLRRWVMVLFVWAGLSGLALPAIACATLMSTQHDCCPEGAPAPCKETWDTDSAVCCVVAPGTPSNTTVASVRSTAELLDNMSPPDTVLLTAWLFASDIFAARSSAIPLPDTPQSRPDAQLTYLHTGRLLL
jgi:hypothetical protein